MLAISPLHKQPTQMLVSCEDLYALFDWKEGLVVDTIAKKGPVHLDVSHDDQYAVEASGQAVTLRRLKSRQPLAVYEGHLNPVSFLAFAPCAYVFATAAKSECLLWNPKDHLKNSGKAVEISNPDRILDLASSDSATALALREIGEGTFMVAVTCGKSTSLFFTKSSGKKTKVVKRQCLLTSAEPVLHA